MGHSCIQHRKNFLSGYWEAFSTLTGHKSAVTNKLMVVHSMVSYASYEDVATLVVSLLIHSLLSRLDITLINYPLISVLQVTKVGWKLGTRLAYQIVFDGYTVTKKRWFDSIWLHQFPTSSASLIKLING